MSIEYASHYNADPEAVFNLILRCLESSKEIEIVCSSEENRRIDLNAEWMSLRYIDYESDVQLEVRENEIYTLYNAGGPDSAMRFVELIKDYLNDAGVSTHFDEP